MATYVTERKLAVVPVDSPNNKFEAVKIQHASDSAAFIRQFYSDDIEIYESSFLVLLNRQHKTIGWVKIGQGGVAGTMIDPILVAKYAVDTLSAAVILAHNHPSGNLNPSQADIDITKRIGEGLRLFSINLLDHIILTKDSYTSLADKGYSF